MCGVSLTLAYKIPLDYGIGALNLKSFLARQL